jgi:serine O-acetyltransferase
MFERISEDINCVFERDPAARNRLEIITSYPGVHALLFHRLTHKLWNVGFKWLARWLSSFARWFTGIEIHPGARIGRRFFIDHGMGVVIGETAEIGDDCTLYHGVTLGGTSWKKGKRHPTLGNDVVVGAGAKILGPVMISSGARIGSNAVVLKDVGAGNTVVGVPGRIIQGDKSEVERRRKAIADKMGFDAYGMHDEMPDPVANAINNMLDHIHTMDQRLEQMCSAIKSLGAEIVDTKMPDLGPCEISSAVSTEMEESQENQEDKQSIGDQDKR